MWQPIETVPRDGTKILLLVMGSCIEGRWIGDLTDWEVVTLPSHGCGCCSGTDDPPSHWMPLPTPPA